MRWLIASRDAQLDQCLPASGTPQAEEVLQVLVDRNQACRHVGNDRKETDDTGHHHDCFKAVAEPGDQQRGDSDNRYGLQKDDIGIKGRAYPARLAEEDGDERPEADTGQQAQQGSCSGEAKTC